MSMFRGTLGTMTDETTLDTTLQSPSLDRAAVQPVDDVPPRHTEDESDAYEATQNADG
jgi:hypothetical protein